ncbi:cation-transporting P-type ATPase [Mycobacterium camsae]|uniref:cation-transporting P-type ATPase n=1 Tax=Mycobacterium gordonae TaxID=1778 RepID=UPI001F11F5E7|nr:cation-transporting P-type ATPase [Mycobacterium gordonae]
MPSTLTANEVAAAEIGEVWRRLDSSVGGLSSAEAAARLVRYGPNVVRTHRVKCSRSWLVNCATRCSSCWPSPRWCRSSSATGRRR